MSTSNAPSPPSSAISTTTSIPPPKSAQAQRMCETRNHPRPRLRPHQLHADRSSPATSALSPAPTSRRITLAASRSFAQLHRRAGDRASPRRRRNPRRPRLASPPHPHDQRQPRRAGRQICPLRPRDAFHRSRNRRRKRPGRLPHVISPNTSSRRTPVWMIGNSPKATSTPPSPPASTPCSPHPHTWVLEHEHVNSAPNGQHFLELTSFDALAEYF